MNKFFRGGRGMSFRKGEQVIDLTSFQDLSMRPTKENKKYLLPTCRPLHYGRGDVRAVKLKIIILPMIIFCVLFSWSLVSPAQGQEADGLAKVKPLQIGDTIPEELWNMPLQVVNHPGEKEIITLNDYRDKKLIILDFWATWCGSCIGSINRFMGTDFSKDQSMAFIGVSYEEKEDVEKSLPRLGANFQTVIQDTILRNHFPHRLIPHIAVIRNGRVLTIADHEILYSKNMLQLMSGKQVDHLVKIDVLNYDKEKEMTEQTDSLLTSSVLFRSTVLGSTLGIAGFCSYSRDEKYQKILLTNKSLLLAMYDLLDSYWHNRIFLEIKNRDQFDIGCVEGDFSRTEWIAKYACGLEAFAPLDYPIEKFKNDALLSLLNHYGYNVAVEDKDNLCQVIYRTAPARIGNGQASVRLSELLKILNNQPLEVERTQIHILDKTLSEDMLIAIDLQRVFNDYAYLSEALENNGFMIKEEVVRQPILLVTERRFL